MELDSPRYLDKTAIGLDPLKDCEMCDVETWKCFLHLCI